MIYKEFCYVNHAGKEMKLKDAKIWELLNIPIGSLLLFSMNKSFHIILCRWGHGSLWQTTAKTSAVEWQNLIQNTFFYRWDSLYTDIEWWLGNAVLCDPATSTILPATTKKLVWEIINPVLFSEAVHTGRAGPPQILPGFQRPVQERKYDTIHRYCCTWNSVNITESCLYGLTSGKWFVPATRHYSWDKGANILGLGRDNLVKVPVDQDSRMDLDKLKNELEICLKKVNLHSHEMTQSRRLPVWKTVLGRWSSCFI